MPFAAMSMANKALPQSSLVITNDKFYYLGYTPMFYISYKSEFKSSKLSYEIQIMPLVIYGLKGGHTHTHTHTHTHKKKQSKKAKSLAAA